MSVYDSSRDKYPATTRDEPLLTTAVCETTPARRGGDLLDFAVWTAICRCSEASVRRAGGIDR